MLLVGVILTGCIFLVSAYILTNQEKFGMCDQPYTTGEYQGCFDESSALGELMGPLAIFLFVISPFLFIIEEKIVKVWIKISSIFIPISLYLTLINSDRSGLFLFPSAQEILSVFFGGTYVLGTVAIFVYGVYKKHKDQNAR